MNSPLSFISQFDRAYGSADPDAAFLQCLLRSSTAMNEEEYAHFLLFLQAVIEEHENASLDRKGTPNLGSAVNQGSADVLNLRLEEGGRCITSSELSRGNPFLIGRSLRPGAYRLVLSTGWVFWEAKLTEQELLWTQAFPEEAVPLAAESQEAKASVPSLKQEILDGELMVRVFPGLESGRLEVTRLG